MARKVRTLFIAVRARRKRRLKARLKRPRAKASPWELRVRYRWPRGRARRVPKLPPVATDRLRAKRLAADETGVEVKHRPLSPQQRRALDALRRWSSALSRAVSEREADELTRKEIEYDQPLLTHIAKRDRAVRRVIREGLEWRSEVKDIVQAWLANPSRSVPKGSRRKLDVSRERGTRKDLTLTEVWLSAEVHRMLDEEGLDPSETEHIRRSLVARLRKVARTGGPHINHIRGQEGASALAVRLDRMKRQSWHELLRRLLAD